MRYFTKYKNESGTTVYQEREKFKDDAGVWRSRCIRHLGTSDKEYKHQKAEREAARRRKLGLVIDKEATALVIHEVKVKPGEWWQLGNHRLYCGDTSTPEFVKAIPKSKLAFADPPYNAGVDDWDTNFIWSHDWLIDKAAIVTVTPGIASLFEFARKTTMPYQWGIACWISNGMTRGKMGFGNWIYTAVFSRDGIHVNSQDFLKVTIDNVLTEETNHKGRKPSQFMLWLLRTFTKVGDIVIDPFLGSGTTLLVAERTGRICYGGEVIPEYCAEIIARWETLTCKKAVNTL